MLGHEDATIDLMNENERLKKALAPFAAYSRVQASMGGNAPKSGVIWGVETVVGHAEITVEDLREAEAALALL